MTGPICRRFRARCWVHRAATQPSGRHCLTAATSPCAAGTRAAWRSCLVLVGLDHAGTAQATSAASSNETDLLAGGSIAGHSGGVANVLVVTTTVGMLHGVHGHTTHLRMDNKGQVLNRKPTTLTWLPVPQIRADLPLPPIPSSSLKPDLLTRTGSTVCGPAAWLTNTSPVTPSSV